MKKTLLTLSALGAAAVITLVNAPVQPRPRGIAFYADAGYPYVVETSTDLVNWVAWTNGIGQGFSNEIWYPVDMTLPQ